MKLPCWLRRLLFLDGRDDRPTLHEAVQASSRALGEATEEAHSLSRTVRAKAKLEQRHAEMVIKVAEHVISTTSNSTNAGVTQNPMNTMLDDALRLLEKKQ